MKKTLKFLVTALFTVVLLTACSLMYNEATTAIGPLESTPSSPEENSSVVQTTESSEAQSSIPEFLDEYVSTVEITEDLLPDENSRERTEDITHIVLHFMSNVVATPDSPYEFEDIKNIFLDYGVSAHYVIDRDGEIYLLVDENRVAYHAGEGEWDNNEIYTNKLNNFSIGIEILAIGTYEEMQMYLHEETYNNIPEENIGYTEEQYEALDELITDILERNENIVFDRNHILGHDEYTPGKTDPGELFDWSRIGLEK